MEQGIRAKIEGIENELTLIDEEIRNLKSRRKNLLSEKECLLALSNDTVVSPKEVVNYAAETFKWHNEVHRVLQDRFKLSSFRPHQEAVINALFSKRDVLLIMPTGGGKSLCYQLPALCMPGVTVVVSPLVSLMEDQKMALLSMDPSFPVNILTSNVSQSEQTKITNAMSDLKLKLIYVTPEKLAKSKRFMSRLEKLHSQKTLSLIAIDEVHCCSQWGHDFRPDYKFLSILKSQFPGVPILGLTATATAQILTDVKSMLNIDDCVLFKSTFNRPNLKYSVIHKSGDVKDDIVELIQTKFKNQSGIVYCFSIKDSDDLAKYFREKGIRALPYHAMLPPENRTEVHSSWTRNKTQIVVATVAFGMGIDKPDVRFVIHHSLPKSVENYYQESGRAGRDGQKAECILYYKFQDVFRQSTMVFSDRTGLSNLYSMLAYCLNENRCRRSVIADHFAEVWQPEDCNRMCDICTCSSHEKTMDVSAEYIKLYTILEHGKSKEERMTAIKTIDAWMGKGSVKLRPPGVEATKWSRETCERVLAHGLLDGFFQEKFHFTPYSTISYLEPGLKARRLKEGSIKAEITFCKLKPLPSSESSSKEKRKNDGSTGSQVESKKHKVDCITLS